MTDEELIAKLFDSDEANTLTNAAARRIEALLAELEAYRNSHLHADKLLLQEKARAKRLEEALQQSTQVLELRYDQINQWKARAEQLEAALVAGRDAAYTKGFSDAEAEISATAIGQQNVFLHNQLARAKAMIEARDAAQAYLDVMWVEESK